MTRNGFFKLITGGLIAPSLNSEGRLIDNDTTKKDDIITSKLLAANSPGSGTICSGEYKGTHMITGCLY